MDAAPGLEATVAILTENMVLMLLFQDELRLFYLLDTWKTHHTSSFEAYYVFLLVSLIV